MLVIIFFLPFLVEPTAVTLTTSTTEPTAKPADKPVYEEPAFIVGMVVLAVLLCFVFFLFLLCLIRPNRHAKGKYDTLKSQTGRQDGTVRSSWAAERMTVCYLRQN